MISVQKIENLGSDVFFLTFMLLVFIPTQCVKAKTNSLKFTNPFLSQSISTEITEKKGAAGGSRMYIILTKCLHKVEFQKVIP